MPSKFANTCGERFHQVNSISSSVQGVQVADLQSKIQPIVRPRSLASFRSYIQRSRLSKLPHSTCGIADTSQTAGHWHVGKEEVQAFSQARPVFDRVLYQQFCPCLFAMIPSKHKRQIFSQTIDEVLRALKLTILNVRRTLT